MIKQKYLKYIIITNFVMIFILSFLVKDAFAVDPYASFRGVPNTVNQQQREIKNIQISNKTGLSTGVGANPIVSVVDNVAKFVTGLIGVLAILMIVISGIMYMTSGGDDDRIKVAKKMLTYSIVGLAVALLAFVIVVSVGKAFGI